MKTQALFGLIIIIFVGMFAIYDALKNRKQTERISRLWHGIKWVILLGISGYVYHDFYAFTFDGIKPAIWTAIASWWVFDLIYNKVSNQEWSYAGDGKGSFLEGIVMWISVKVKLNNAITLHLLKLVVTIMAIFLIN